MSCCVLPQMIYGTVEDEVCTFYCVKFLTLRGPLTHCGGTDSFDQNDLTRTGRKDELA